MGARSAIREVDPQLGELTLDRLTRDVAVWQRVRGHRFSVDDVVTAWVASLAAPHARTVVDLGCGLGSVLLHLAWSLPEARLVGIEAQAQSFALAQRNVAHNRLGERVAVHLGDVRECERLDLGPADLVTGTPPYFPPARALDAADAQRTFARIEYRGGVEAYVAAGASLIGADGRLVICGDARAGDRMTQAARAHALHVVARLDVIARAPRPPLFMVWTLARAAHELSASSLTLRDEEGRRTASAEGLRAFSGIA